MFFICNFSDGFLGIKLSFSLLIKASVFSLSVYKILLFFVKFVYFSDAKYETPDKLKCLCSLALHY
jgi:hypothetical protein